PDARLGPFRELARRVEGLAGYVPMRWRIEPRFDYGRAATRIEARQPFPVAFSRGDALGVCAWDAGACRCDATAVAGDLEALNGPQGRYVRDKEVAEAAAGQLNKAGIKTTVKTYEFVNYLNNLTYKHKGGPVWLIGWGTPTIDAETV